jgi:hypothetical protein
VFQSVGLKSNVGVVHGPCNLGHRRDRGRHDHRQVRPHRRAPACRTTSGGSAAPGGAFGWPSAFCDEPRSHRPHESLAPDPFALRVA